MNTQEILGAFAYVFALAMPAIGSLLGANAAGMAALGAWKKCFLENRPAPFLLVAFVGAPALPDHLRLDPDERRARRAGGSAPAHAICHWAYGRADSGRFGVGAGPGGSSGCGRPCRPRERLGNFIIVIGIIETVALMVMVFMMTALK